jgi:formamidopyrimidine-DNA glycosylase
MPELPEVETIRRDLEAALRGDHAVSFTVYDRRLMSRKVEEAVRHYVLGQIWKGFHRKGKYLSIELANGWGLVFHLRMTGQLLVLPHPNPLPVGEGARRPGEAKPRMVILFASGRTLGFYDQRRFGEVSLLRPGQIWREKNPLGPDALTELKRDQFVSLVKSRTTRIQPLLMDQRYLAGVGNIYAQEALFKAAIRPGRAGNRITEKEAGRLFETLQETLQTAISYRGSSSRNYRDASGAQGSAQTLHAVYRKGGQPCPQCGGILRATRVGGRGSVFCPRCQK